VARAAIHLATLLNILSAAHNTGIKLATIYQFEFRLGAIARRAFLAVAPMLLFGCVQVKAETMLSAGVSGSTNLKHYVAANIEKKWTAQQWEFWTLTEGRLQYRNFLGDASFNSDWHAETNISTLTQIELDASYEFEREKTDFIGQEHGLSGDFGLTHRFDEYTLKTDFGVNTNLFEDTTQVGFPSLDRSHENNLGIELAARFTGNTSQLLNPFFEVAYVGRNYLNNTRRDFAGLDFVLGSNFVHTNLIGDIGLFFSSRHGNEVSRRFVMGPQVDLEWTVDDRRSIKLAIGAGLKQDTSGPSELFQTHSMRFEAVHKFAEDLKLIVIFEALRENRESSVLTELAPELKLEWSDRSGFGIYGSAAVTYEKTQGNPSNLDPRFDVGLKWRW
jgi:hypothetical protein